MSTESNLGDGPTDAAQRKGFGILPKLFIAACVLVGVLVGIVAVQPADFRVVRSATIAASPDQVFPHVDNLRQWQAWSPWEKRDPDSNKTYSGADAGVGAAYEWDGNDEVGAGRMTITESRPSEYVQLRLEFLRPFEATNTAEFTFEPQEATTTVTWAVFGQNNFFAKAFSLFVDMDAMLGADFDEGLASLKSVIEGNSEGTDEEADQTSDAQ